MRAYIFGFFDHGYSEGDITFVGPDNVDFKGLCSQLLDKAAENVIERIMNCNEGYRFVTSDDICEEMATLLEPHGFVVSKPIVAGFAPPPLGHEKHMDFEKEWQQRMWRYNKHISQRLQEATNAGEPERQESQ